MRARKGQDRPDPTRAVQARRDLDNVLRQALHAAVDTVEPADDGLTRIRHRLTMPSAMRQARLLVTDCVDLARLITIWLEPVFTGAIRHRWRRHDGYRRGPSHEASRATVRPARPRLRPILVVASAAAIVVIAVIMFGPVRQIVTRTGLNAGTGASTPAHAGAHSAGGHGQSPTTNLTQASPTGPGTTSAQGGHAPHRPSCPAAKCPTKPDTIPSPGITPSGSPAATPSQNASPTPTPSKTNHGRHRPHPGKSHKPHPGKSHKPHPGKTKGS